VVRPVLVEAFGFGVVFATSIFINDYIEKTKMGPGMVACVYNRSYSGGVDRRSGSRPVLGTNLRIYLKKKKKLEAWLK
jgi:hypothetical protein